MGIEQTINQQLNNYPKVKKIIKRAYQRILYAVSPKIKSEGNIERVSPDDKDHEYFFGYYDKSPEDDTGRYVLCLKANNTWSNVAPKKPAQILLIDKSKNKNDIEKIRVLAETHAWNVQQGCMLQWLGPDFNSNIIFNDFRDGKYVSIIMDVFSGSESVIDMPVYSVANDGTYALSLDFSRLHRLRPGYGYSNIKDKTANEKIPDSTAIWKINLRDNTVLPLLTYKDFANFEPRYEMKTAEHKVNHIMISPNGKRFMVLHRWYVGDRKYSRLITVDADGTGMYNLSDDDMISHCYWKNNNEIIAFENKKGRGAGYYLMKDCSQEFKRLWDHINSDGHPSYSPDGKLVLTDTYPNRKRIAIIKILNEDFNVVVARVFAPFKYDNDTRCDLHPRWSRDGKSIYFDSVYEGHRGLYRVDVSKVRFAYRENIGTELKEKTNRDRIKIVFLLTACKKLGPVQQTLNIIKNLDQDRFDPILITLYDEGMDSRMSDYLPYVRAHYLVKTGKVAILTGKDDALRKKLDEIQPDIIHSVGVFPDYAVSHMGKYVHILTLRNYVYDDYLEKYGKVKGMLLAQLQIYSMKNSDKVVTCSESLSKIYKDKMGVWFDYIRNGVDVELYTAATDSEKKNLREKLSIPVDAFVFIYTGQFIERKNIPFLLETFNEFSLQNEKVHLMLLGDGAEYPFISSKYKDDKRIDFRGNVDNVNEYLKASDVFVSTSKSEGLPNSALEAMATGLPVLLSDIPQHKELFDPDLGIGYLYQSGNKADLKDKMSNILEKDSKEMGNKAYKSAHRNFDSIKMSKKYQGLYIELMNRKRELCHERYKIL